MSYHKIPRVIAIVVGLAGLMAIAGWVFDVQFLKSLSFSLVPMKFVSAICFALAGVIIFVLSDVVHDAPEVGPIISSVATLIITIVMASLLFSKFIGINCGIESLFIKESYCPPETVLPGQPSVATMICFLLIAVLDILAKLKVWYWRGAFIVTGCVIGSAGIGSLIGYATGDISMAHYVPGFSSAMSFFSATLFSLIGITIIMLGVRHKNLPQ